MCKEYCKVVSKNKYGQLSYCSSYKLFNLTFKNILIELSLKELIAFQKLIQEIDIDYWQSNFNRKFVKRNIPILTNQQNLILIFSFQELNYLKEIVFLDNNTNKDYISYSDLLTDLSLN